jgi:hypothetical protein
VAANPANNQPQHHCLDGLGKCSTRLSFLRKRLSNLQLCITGGSGWGGILILKQTNASPIKPGDKIMNRYIVNTLSVVLLSAISAPALALTPRFDDARNNNLNKALTSEVSLSPRFDDARSENLNKLNPRFDNARSENLNKLNPRFDDARSENLNKLSPRFDDARSENLNKLNPRFDDARTENLNK